MGAGRAVFRHRQSRRARPGPAVHRRLARRVAGVADPAGRPERAVRRRHGRDDGGPGQPGRRLPRLRAGRGRIRLAHHPGAGHRHRPPRCATNWRWTKWVDPTWLPDESGFLYWRYPEPAGRNSPRRWTPANCCCTGSVTTRPVPTRLVWARPDDREWMAEPWVAADGGWLVLTTSPGTDSRSTIEAYRLVTDDDGVCQIDDDPVVVVGELTDAHHVVASVGDTLYLRTERDAPRGRLVAVDLAAPGKPWTEIVGQHDDRCAGRRPARRRRLRAVVVDRRGAPGRDLGLTGEHRGWPELPAPISVTALNSRQPSSEIFIGVTSFTRRAPLLPDRCRRAGATRRLPQPADGPRSTYPMSLSNGPAGYRKTAQLFR